MVKEQADPDSPVYHIKAENGKGPVLTLHRNMLLPVQFLPVKEQKVVTKKPERQKRVTRPNGASSSESSESSGTDSFDDNVVFIPVHDDTTDLHDDTNDMHADDVPLNDTLTESTVPVDDIVIAEPELQLSHHSGNVDQSSVHGVSAHLDSYQAESQEEQLTLNLESEASDD